MDLPTRNTAKRHRQRRRGLRFCGWQIYSALFGIQFCCIIYNEDLFEQYDLTPSRHLDGRSPWLARSGRLLRIRSDLFRRRQYLHCHDRGQHVRLQPARLHRQGGFLWDSQVWKARPNMIQELIDAGGAYNTSASTDGSNEIVSQMTAGDAPSWLSTAPAATPALRKPILNAPWERQRVPS